MSDYYGIATAVFSAVATGFAAFATWQAPRAAAKSWRNHCVETRRRRKKGKEASYRYSSR
jgi:hypothetical protein